MDPVVLYKRGKRANQIIMWKAWVDDSGEFPCFMRESGLIDGKRTLKKKFVKKGKNIGKANETTAYEQAVLEMEKTVKGNIEDNMVYDVNLIDLPPRFVKPALAKGDIKKAKYPCYAQPKFNGARCIQMRQSEEFDLLTRNRKIWGASDHVKEACNLFGSYSPDGELYTHGLTFQQIISLVKKYYELGEHEDYPELCSKDIQYHVYDLAIPNKTYEQRKEILERIIPENHPIIKPVFTVLVNNEEEMLKWHDKWVAEGYEGIILRDPHAEYAFNSRSNSLIKFKKFFDKEFPIVGHDFEEWHDINTDKIERLVMWICETEKGEKFSVRPTGTFASRIRDYKNAESKYGMPLTVRYQEYSEDGTPIFGVGVGIRDYE